MSNGSNHAYLWLIADDTTNTLGLPEFSVPIGTPGASKSSPYKRRYDSTKVRSVLGMKFRDMPITAKDTFEDYKARGWTLSGGVQFGLKIM